MAAYGAQDSFFAVPGREHKENLAFRGKETEYVGKGQGVHLSLDPMFPSDMSY